MAPTVHILSVAIIAITTLNYAHANWAALLAEIVETRLRERLMSAHCTCDPDGGGGNLGDGGGLDPGTGSPGGGLQPYTEHVENSACDDDGDCECFPGYEGDPNFFCVKASDYHYCTCSNDPGLRTFGGEHFVYHVIGSTRLVHMRTVREGGGACEFQLWGWTRRYKGKYYFGGLTFELVQEIAGNPYVRHGTIDAKGESGQPYTWEIHITGDDHDTPIHDTITSFSRDNYQGIVLDGSPVEYSRIPNDFLKFSISLCGIEFAIRGHHPDYPDFVPGFWLRVAKSSSPTYVVWEDNGENGEPLCLDHTKTVTVADLVSKSGVTRSKREAMTLFAITNTDFAEYPDAPEQLSDLKHKLRDCDSAKRDTLFSLIRFFFDNPKFTHCLNGDNSTTVASSIEGIHLAADLVCDEVSTSCGNLTSLIGDQACQKVHDEFPEIAVLSNPSLCP